MKFTKGENIKKIIYLNTVVTFIAQALQIVLGFIIRKLFIQYLGISYLGYNSVFVNILQMLNLADMGIGVAITSFLYKPIAENDECRINALMFLYKRIYETLGVVVFFIGLIISIFLPILIPDAQCSDGYLRLLFFINLIATVSTYYLAFKRTLLIADQKSYVTSAVDSIIFLITSLLQLCILIFWPNYILYLIVSLAKNIVSNLILSLYSDCRYGKIKKTKDNYYIEYFPKVINYVKDVFVSRIGAFIYYGTDNVIISIFKGSLITGYLSNYTLVTVQVTNVVNQILASIQATFGNYIIKEVDKKKQKEMTNNYLLVNYLIGNFCFLCVALLIQPFIKLLFGNFYLLDNVTAVLLSINLMLTIMLQLPSQLFVIYQLYKYDRPIIIISATLNIIVSCLLVNSLGINGVLIGTFFTSLLYLFSRFYIISKVVFKTNYSNYFIKIVLYFSVSVISFFVEYIVIRQFNGNSIIFFGARAVIVIVLSILIPSACLCRNKEFIYMLNKFIPQKVRKNISEKKIIYITTTIITILIISGFII